MQTNIFFLVDFIYQTFELCHKLIFFIIFEIYKQVFTVLLSYICGGTIFVFHRNSNVTGIQNSHENLPGNYIHIM